jgi:hypothetical protein
VRDVVIMPLFLLFYAFLLLEKCRTGFAAAAPGRATRARRPPVMFFLHIFEYFLVFQKRFRGN